MLDPKVFKAYDVRGIYPDELDEAGAEAIGRAYVEQFEPRRIAVGRDMRLSSPAMQEALMRGAATAGADVLDLGLVGTEMVYFAVGSLGLEGGAMVTASHNPKQYTGMKLVRRGALPVGGESGPLRRPRPSDGRGRRAGSSHRTRPEGTIEEHDIWPAYVERVLSFVDVGAIKPLRVVIDAANGMAGTMLPPVLERLPIEAVRCYFEPDGSFPNHEPNPLLPENREFIVRKTLEEGADLGVAFDGDADRCFFVDDTGEFVPGDFVTALFAESLLEKEPGAKIIYDVRASRAVPDTIERDGGVPLVNRVGHAFIKARMRKEDAAFAGEVSGHYYFRDFSQADSGRRPVPAHARADLEEGPAALGDSRAAALALLHHRRAQHAGPGRRAQAAGAEGAIRRRARLASRRDLGRLRRLALQRPPVEHRAAAAPQPRGDVGGADGAEARRGARGDPLVSGEYAFSTRTRVGFSDTDAQGIVYYGRYNPYFDLARVEYLRSLGLLHHEAGGEFVMRANDVEYFAPAVFDDEIEIHVRVSRLGRTSVTFEFAAFKRARRDAAGHRPPDARLHRPRRATAARSRIPDAYSSAVRCRRLTPTSSCGGPSRSSPPRDELQPGPGSTSSRRRASCSGPRPARRNPTRRMASPWCGGTRVSPSSPPTATVAQAELEAVAAEIGELCLVGWDTGGELWQS